MHSENWGINKIREERNRLAGELLIADGKLEAIKTWLIEAKAQGRISISVGFSLDQILEAEGL